MASLDLGLNEAGDVTELQTITASTNNSPTYQAHHVIDLSASTAPRLPPAALSKQAEALASTPGNVIDFGDFPPPPQSHRTIRVASSADSEGVAEDNIDESLLAELPSVQQMQRHMRPSTATAMKARRTSRANELALKRTRRSQVRPLMHNDLDLDEPSRLQNRWVAMLPSSLLCSAHLCIFSETTSELSSPACSSSGLTSNYGGTCSARSDVTLFLSGVRQSSLLKGNSAAP